MDIKKFGENIPLLPLSAIAFYLIVLILISLKVIPSSTEIVILLENLYKNYGLISLFVGAFFEGLVYIGLYFAGSFIIFFIILFSDGKFISLLNISLIITSALTLTSLINYALGRYIFSKQLRESKEIEKKKRISNGLILSAIHPNFLAFYFFNLGLKKKGIWNIIFVPIIMIPYGLFLAFLITSLKSILRGSAENPYILITALLIWFVIAFMLKNKPLIKR